jgi:hypothetical protein
LRGARDLNDQRGIPRPWPYIQAFPPYIKGIPRTSGDPLARHLFSVGQDVTLHSSIFVPASSPGAHRIIAILPDGGEEPRYLIKFGPATRVVSQHDIKAHIAGSGSAAAVFAQAS